MARTKHQRKKKADKATVNPFREQHNETVSAGMARKVKPSILILKERGDLTQGEFDALSHYREQAGLAEKSPVRDSCDFTPRGGGNGPGVTITSAKIETDRLNGLLGSLKHITHAIAVDDMSLTQWSCKQYGGRERYKGGKVVSIEPKGRLSVQMARFELKFAARRMMV